MSRLGGVPGHSVLRLAQRFLSYRTLETVVRPALADVQHEAALASTGGRWRRCAVLARGYAALGRALAVWLVAWPARAAREDWLRKGAPGPRLLGALAPRALLVGALALVPILRPHPVPSALPFVVPGLLTGLAPAVFVLGLVLALGRIDPEGGREALRHWLGPVAALALAATVFTFVSLTWVPVTNQAFRERVVRELTREGVTGKGFFPAKGLREMTLGELSDRRRDAPSDAAARVEWNKRWALPAACLAFGPLALGLHGLRRRRRTPLPFLAALSIAFLFYAVLRAAELAGMAGRLGPVAAAWAGDALVALLATGLLLRVPPAEEGPLAG